jgi:hypothetical protein
VVADDPVSRLIEYEVRMPTLDILLSVGSGTQINRPFTRKVRSSSDRNCWHCKSCEGNSETHTGSNQQSNAVFGGLRGKT